MCVTEQVLTDQCDRMHGFLGAARQLVAANAENGEQRWSGVLLLLAEVDDCLTKLEGALLDCSDGKVVTLAKDDDRGNGDGDP